MNKMQLYEEKKTFILKNIVRINFKLFFLIFFMKKNNNSTISMRKIVFLLRMKNGFIVKHTHLQ